MYENCWYTISSRERRTSCQCRVGSTGTLRHIVLGDRTYSMKTVDHMDSMATVRSVMHIWVVAIREISRSYPLVMPVDKSPQLWEHLVPQEDIQLALARTASPSWSRTMNPQLRCIDSGMNEMNQPSALIFSWSCGGAIHLFWAASQRIRCCCSLSPRSSIRFKTSAATSSSDRPFFSLIKFVAHTPPSP